MTAPPLSPSDAEAATIEYVLGTLPAEERRAFEAAMAADPTLTDEVRAWNERLAPLAEGVAPVEPSAALWPAIEDSLDTGEGASGPEAETNVVSWALAAELARTRRSRSVWRIATAAAASLAAMLALVIAGDLLRPSASPAGLVAVVNRSGDLPALIVRVDPRAGSVQVRALAAEVPAERSLELWSIVSGGAPRSLGVVAPGPTRVAVPAEDRGQLVGATIAVTVEPTGGSSTGGPTGPVVYQGRLVSELP